MSMRHITIHNLDCDNRPDDEEVEEMVFELVHSYICRPRSIILAVVSALSDRGQYLNST